jgi:hypothetical protein
MFVSCLVWNCIQDCLAPGTVFWGIGVDYRGLWRFVQSLLLGGIGVPMMESDCIGSSYIINSVMRITQLILSVLTTPLPKQQWFLHMRSFAISGHILREVFPEGLLQGYQSPYIELTWMLGTSNLSTWNVSLPSWHQLTDGFGTQT